MVVTPRVNVKHFDRPCLLREMSLLCYLKPIKGLPDPRGSLSRTIPREVIAVAKKVQKTLTSTNKSGRYRKYTPAQCPESGKYSCQYRAAVAA